MTKLSTLRNQDPTLERKLWKYSASARRTAKKVFMPTIGILSSSAALYGPASLASDSSMVLLANAWEIRNHDKKNITKVLMDQSIFSGIGNYVKSESLYQARISPLLKVNQIDDTRLKKLYLTIRNVILSSYNSQSNTIKSLKDTPRLLGSLGFTFSVFNKKKDLYGNKIVKTKTPDGRTTHWVPDLQK